MLIKHNERNKESLAQLINQKREAMMKTAERFGINSKKTLECSELLDELIIRHLRMTRAEKEKIR